MPDTWRPVQIDSDHDKIIELLVASRQAGLADSEFRPAGLLGFLSRPELVAQNATLALQDHNGKLMALGVLWRGNTLGMLVHPNAHRHAELKLIEWAGSAVTGDLAVVARNDNSFVMDTLSSLGYVTGFAELRMIRNLRDGIPSPQIPDGFTVRPLSGPGELPAWVDLYNQAFGDTSIPGPTTLSRWQARLDHPDYDPELNIVVINPSGELVAMCHCSIDRIEAERIRPAQGRTEPIATRVDARRKGLARAAILTGLHRLRERGVDEALLTTDSDNTPAHQLYRSLGFRTAYAAVWHSRTK